jgi:hypothetical protein
VRTAQGQCPGLFVWKKQRLWLPTTILADHVDIVEKQAFINKTKNWQKWSRSSEFPKSKSANYLPI